MAHPHGMPVESDFRLVESKMPVPGPGEALVRAALYLSVDPYMRGRIGGQNSYAKPVEPGSVIVGGVASSKCSNRTTREPCAKGDYVRRGRWDGSEIPLSHRRRPCERSIPSSRRSVPRCTFWDFQVWPRTSGCSTFAGRSRANAWSSPARRSRGVACGTDRQAQRLPRGGYRGHRRER